MARTPKDNSAPPQEVAAVTPRDLHPTSDIRFVMIEVGKLTANVDRLITDIDSLTEKFELKAKENIVEITKVCDRLLQAETSISSLVSSKNAPWYRRLDPANLMLAAVGIVTLLLTLILGNGRFEDISKRLDSAESHATQAEQRSYTLEDRVSTKLDQIQGDLATIKAERATESRSSSKK